MRDGQDITDAEAEELRKLIGDTIGIAQADLETLPRPMTNRYMPKPENDNTPLTTEQKFRLRLMEKTGTGSLSIH